MLGLYYAIFQVFIDKNCRVNVYFLCVVVFFVRNFCVYIVFFRRYFYHCSVAIMLYVLRAYSVSVLCTFLCHLLSFNVITNITVTVIIFFFTFFV